MLYDGSHPHTDTAILMAADDRNPAFDWSQISEVDGNSARPVSGHLVHGVRVLPGTRAFVIRAIRNFDSDTAYWGGYDYLEFNVVVPDMKPLHVHVARYHGTGDGLSIVIEDLGERASYRTRRSPKVSF